MEGGCLKKFKKRLLGKGRPTADAGKVADADLAAADSGAAA